MRLVSQTCTHIKNQSTTTLSKSRESHTRTKHIFLLHILPVVKYASIQSYQYIHGEATILFYFLDTTRKPPSDSLSGSDML